MQKQRKLFYHEKPAKTVRKDGTNLLVPDRRHVPIKLADVEVRFDDPAITGCGGYPAWGLFEKRIGLASELASHIKMNRGPLAFTVPELSRFLIDCRILGADRLMHAERFRLDPMLTASYGIDGLPSGKTIGIYLKQYKGHHLDSLERLNIKMNRKLWKKVYGKKRWRGVMDYDSTTMSVYGKQEGADRGRCFRRKDSPGFQPKFAFLGGLGLMVNQKLLPQTHNLTRNLLAFHEESMAKLPPKVNIWAIRGDTALYSLENVRYFEKHGLTYAISAQHNVYLREVILEIPEECWQEGEDEYGRPVSVTRIKYCPKTWREKGERDRTYVVSRRLKEKPEQAPLWKGEAYKYFAYITNYRAPVQDQYAFCVERCSLESFIKESKHGFRYDFLPCKEESANRAYLGHVQLAYNLSIFWKLLVAPRGINRWTIQTIRDRFLCIAGRLVREGSQWVVSLAEWWPYRTEYERVWKQCAKLTPT